MRAAAISLAVLLAVPATAAANGRFPRSTSVHARPGDVDDIYLGLTFGLVISHDDGQHWDWLCEESIGYGGDYDPKYEIDPDGTIYAGTFDGLRVSRDGGCTFQTATDDQPDGPDKIAGLWVDALALDADGTVWVGTAESGLSNAVYKSTDQARTFTKMGLESMTLWWKSVRVAPSNTQRVYVSGYQVAPTTEIALRRSDDAGVGWADLPLTDIAVGKSPLVLFEAVDPADPDVVFARSVQVNQPAGDRLYRSSDGGQSWTAVLDTSDAIRGVVIRADGEVLVGVAKDPDFADAGAVFRSSDGGLTFAEMPGPQLGCLAERADGTVLGCGANWDPDYAALLRSTDGLDYSKVFRFHEMAGPLACPSGTIQHDTCELQRWPAIREQFGVTGPVDAGAGPDAAGDGADGGGGCCDGGGGGAGAILLAFGAAAALWWKRPRKRACCD